MVSTFRKLYALLTAVVCMLVTSYFVTLHFKNPYSRRLLQGPDSSSNVIAPKAACNDAAKSRLIKDVIDDHVTGTDVSNGWMGQRAFAQSDDEYEGENEGGDDNTTTEDWVVVEEDGVEVKGQAGEQRVQPIYLGSQGHSKNASSLGSVKDNPKEEESVSHKADMGSLQPNTSQTTVGEAGEQSLEQPKDTVPLSTQYQTSDKWPQFSKDYFPHPIKASPFKPNFTIKWDFDVNAFLQRPDVKGRPPKVMTWMVKTRYTPQLPEQVRLRVCPEMPCRITTNRKWQNESALLMWAGQIMTESSPPARSHNDQVYLFHNHEPQDQVWIHRPSFLSSSWRSVFNWTMTYRSDSDIVDLYGKLVPRESPVTKNYTHILAKKTKMVAQLVSNCATFSRREKYVRQLQKYTKVDVFGECSKLKCSRSSDDACFEMFSTEYKFFLSFENSFCKDYITEKFFRFMGADLVVVARGSNDYQNHAPPGTFINTADFKSPKELADHLLYLDSHPEEYIKILRAKDGLLPVFEDWPIRDSRGAVRYMTYHYSNVAWCEVCRRLWELDSYRKTVTDISQWFDKHNCVPPTDLS